MKNTLGKAAIGIAAVAVPTKISADYQAQIRQMAIWAHTAGTDAEKQMADKITQVAIQKGMSQKALASAVSGLIEKGISWEESVDYAPLIADLVDGQGMEAETIATLFSAFKEAGVAKEDMGAMLGQVAAAGDIGAFGPKDMAKYMPALLGTIKRLGMEGPEAVRFLGASLQSQFSQTQDAAAAATNMDNLLNAVISSTSQKRFAMAGYDLTGSILAATKSGKAANPVEAFIMLSEKLIARQDPEKAKRVEALKARIQTAKAGSAEEEQAMVALIEAAGLASIVSDKSSSAGLLAQIKYGKTIKQNMADIKDTDGQAKIEKDAAAGPQRVFVVNAAAMGGFGGAGGRAGSRSGSRGGRGRTGRRRAGGAGGGPRPPRPPVPPRPPIPPIPPVPPGRAARAMGLIGKVGKVGKLIPGAALIEGGMRALDTFQNADTQDAKAEGYGAAAGNVAGALAGAAAGAAIGSVVPILGTAIGGVIGGILGSMGGESIGASLGKSWFGSDDKKPLEPVANGLAFDPHLTRSLPGATNMGDVVRSFSSAAPTGPLAMPPKIESIFKAAPPRIDQKIDINAPLQITVKGDVKDPAALARELQPHLQRQMEQIGQQMSSRNLYDAPHVG